MSTALLHGALPHLIVPTLTSRHCFPIKGCPLSVDLHSQLWLGSRAGVSWLWSGSHPRVRVRPDLSAHLARHSLVSHHSHRVFQVQCGTRAPGGKRVLNLIFQSANDGNTFAIQISAEFSGARCILGKGTALDAPLSLSVPPLTERFSFCLLPPLSFLPPKRFARRP